MLCAQLVAMLQETHAALLASNEHLLSEVATLKAQHALEVDGFRRNFDELLAEMNRVRAQAPDKPVAPQLPAAGAPILSQNPSGKRAVGGSGAAGVRRSQGVASIVSRGKEN